MSDGRGGASQWTDWLVPVGAVLISAALLLVAFWPRNGPAPSPLPGPSTTGTADEHEVVTDEGVVSFRLEGDVIVVRVTTGAQTTELGRIADVGGGAVMHAMVCHPEDTQNARRYVFGHLNPGSQATYAGPEAVGHVASDGLFLFALKPGAASGSISVTTTDGSGVAFKADIFISAQTSGQKQPSGCFVLG